MTPKNNAATLRLGTDRGAWWWAGWHEEVVAGGLTSRRTTIEDTLRDLRPVPTAIAAEQVHGASIALIEQAAGAASPVPGCDALVTSRPGLALLIRTADCLPLFFVSPARRLIGLAHAGWRGLAAGLPQRMVSSFRHAYQALPESLHVAIGPAIRSCCYEVGPEFAARFGAFVRRYGPRYRCDLIGVAKAQLRASGVPAGHIVDAGRCTHCEGGEWFSRRREGQAAGRLTSLIVLKPPHGV